MNSHVQITKGLLKGFAIKTKDGLKVKCLNLKTNVISDEKIKELGTFEDYYPEIVENALSKRIETPFGLICKRIRVFEKEKTTLQFSKKDNFIIKQFFHYCLSRSTKILKSVNDKSVFAYIIGGLEQYHLFGLENLNPDVNIFTDKKTNLFINKTDVNFVIPKNCFYIVPLSSSNRTYYYVLPISPKIAIILHDSGEFSKYIISNVQTRYGTLENKAIVEAFNLAALKTEKSMDNSFIVSQTEKELLYLQKLNRIKPINH